jgi:hypothetical protein
MLKRVSLAVLLFLSTTGAVHAGTSSGKVDSYATTAVTFYFKTTSTVTSKPACSVNSGFAVPLNTEFGRAIRAQVAEAKSFGLTLSVTGSNVCATAGDAEDVLYITVSGSPSASSPFQYWATSGADRSCLNVCSFTGGFAAANSSGQVCKGLDGKAYGQEWLPASRSHYVCGFDDNRTTQCNCYKQ